MAVRDIFKVNRKTFFNPTAWIGLESLIAFNRMFKNIFSTMFTTPPAPAKEQTFEESMKQFGLTESDVKDGAGTYQALAIIFGIMGLAALIYGLYLLFFYRSFTGTLLSIAVTSFMFAQAFRFDFWSLQMRKRKLGLTFDDWKRHYFGG